MYDHVGLRVRNLDASVRFYEAALAPLGHVLGSRDETSAGLGPKAAPALWLTLAKQEKNTAKRQTGGRGGGIAWAILWSGRATASPMPPRSVSSKRPVRGPIRSY